MCVLCARVLPRADEKNRRHGRRETVMVSLQATEDSGGSRCVFATLVFIFHPLAVTVPSYRARARTANVAFGIQPLSPFIATM